MIQNAIKFSRPQGHAELWCSAATGRVLIEIRDECSGLHPGKPEFFPAPFHRGAKDADPGVGLSVARGCIEAIGGTLGLRDVPSVGCVFTIDLAMS